MVLSKSKRKHNLFEEVSITSNRKDKTVTVLVGNMTVVLGYYETLNWACTLERAAQRIAPSDNYTKVASVRHWEH